jgi:hypothetical protein
VGLWRAAVTPTTLVLIFLAASVLSLLMASMAAATSDPVERMFAVAAVAVPLLFVSFIAGELLALDQASWAWAAAAAGAARRDLRPIAWLAAGLTAVDDLIIDQSFSADAIMPFVLTVAALGAALGAYATLWSRFRRCAGRR